MCCCDSRPKAQYSTPSKEAPSGACEHRCLFASFAKRHKNRWQARLTMRSAGDISQAARPSRAGAALPRAAACDRHERPLEVAASRQLTGSWRLDLAGERPGICKNVLFGSFHKLVLMKGIEPLTSPLPRECSTPEPHQRN